MIPRCTVLILSFLLLSQETFGLSSLPLLAPSVDAVTAPSNYWDRRSFLGTITSGGLILFLLPPSIANAAPPRSVDVGGGVDVAIDTRNTVLSDPSNLVFPASMKGRYACQRTVVAVDGDVYQAQSAWKSLGGGKGNFFGGNTVPESYETQLIPMMIANNNGGDNPKFTVVDRGYELASRTAISRDAVQWKVGQPNRITTAASNNNVELAVIQRSVIPPNPEQGILAGGQELIRITEGPFVRAVLIKQRFRQAGDGVVEGLEIMKTYRVLDGIAGTEFPTSTTKSTLRWTRIGPLQQEEVVDAKYVSSSSLYFDGSNWY
ncbi:expressed unknown protein [Seminavis robusta]|uniref:DUF6816 domain-containing protein n=1 Tax=Seminavis robusta TaxID=568900 RepID=A0A9N8DV61_9STRA|nr:expressed unknown protein [Seminavis robusta]|eukprot:Sro366_g127670.1 n/a (319) ;mRNA; f:67823-68779